MAAAGRPRLPGVTGPSRVRDADGPESKPLPDSGRLLVAPAAATHASRASDLAARLGGVPVAEPLPARTLPDGQWMLVVGATLALRCGGVATADLSIDANAPGIRRRAAAGRSLELLRALPRGSGLRIVDATGGLGRDAFTLAHAGHDVLLVERQPLLAALLHDACTRAECAGRVRCVAGDSRQVLAGLDFVPAAVLVDPMFTSGEAGAGAAARGTAAPKAAAQWLRRLVMDDGDAMEALLRAAAGSGAPRVVAKRARRGAVVAAAGLRHHHSILGRSVCFDVYVPAAGA